MELKKALLWAIAIAFVVFVAYLFMGSNKFNEYMQCPVGQPAASISTENSKAVVSTASEGSSEVVKTQSVEESCNPWDFQCPVKKK